MSVAVGRVLRPLRPVDPASLAVARILFGLLLLALVVRYVAHGWIDEYFYAPAHFFTYPGLGWVEPWPWPGMYVHFGAMAACAVAVAAGFHHRVAAAAYGLLLAYAHACDVTAYLNHYYLLVLLCLLFALVPASACWSVDAARGRTAAPAIPAWCLWLLRFQVGCVYVFGGVAKLKPSWLVDGEPLTTWLGARPDFPLLGAWFVEPRVALAASWVAALFDLTIVLWLSWRRSRPLAYVAVIGFHVTTGMLFHLGMFPWVMTAMATLFFDPSWPRRLMRRPAPAVLGPWPGFAPPPLIAALVLYAAVQVLVPLRHWAYPGDVLWTEQGYRFAWNVMLMEKSGACELRAVEPDTARRWVIPPSRYYTPYQAAMMATQPDLILQFAHTAAADLRRQGVRGPRIYADCFASLHGRPRARLIDPTVDLAAARDALAPRPWITPHPTVLE